VRSTDDSAQAREIARELGGLALGLEQAGAYIATEHIDFARYLKLWRESREKVIGWFDPNVVAYGHDTGLAATWATSVDRLSSQSRRLLDRLALLAPAPIPDSLIDVAVPSETPDYDAHQAKAGLFAYSLIARAAGEDGSGKGFVMHRLVQDFAWRAMTNEQRAAALGEALEWVNAALKGEPQDVREWPVVDALAPHALAVATRADRAGVATPTARLLQYLGLLFHTKARYADAEPLLRRALAINEVRYGPNRPELMASLNNLAILLKTTNREAEAEPLYRRAIAIDEMALGPGHVTVALRLSNLATLLRATNRPQEAEKLHRRALAIREKELEPDAPDVAQSLNDLGVLLRAINLGEAEALLRRALAIRDKAYGDGHTHVAQTLNNLGGLLRETNRHSEAEPLFRRAIGIWEKHFGPEHPDLAISLSNYALLLEMTNREDEAEPLVRRALAIFEKSLGKDHPNSAYLRARLTALESAQRRT
jgi:tetratricopeptide (TPR) repeat protein